MTTWQPRDTRIDNGNAKPEGWISPEEQGRRDYERYHQRVSRERPDCAQFHAHQVLIEHQRKDIGGCICGWGVDSGDLGRSFASHIIDELGRAGLRITDR